MALNMISNVDHTPNITNKKCSEIPVDGNDAQRHDRCRATKDVNGGPDVANQRTKVPFTCHL